jgi:hypothetical protein
MNTQSSAFVNWGLPHLDFTAAYLCGKYPTGQQLQTYLCQHRTVAISETSEAPQATMHLQ